jgi:Domain of unknown function (DUF4082)
MTIAEDASTPSVVTATADTTGVITTASFTPPANSLLVAVFNVGYTSAAAPVVSVSDSGGGTWTSGGGIGTTKSNSLVWWRYCTTSPGAITVTATDTQHASAGRQLVVRVLTGASPQQGRAYGATFITTAPTGTVDFHYGVTGNQFTGSWTYVASCQDTSSLTLTPTAGTTSISGLNDTTDSVNMAVGRKTTPTVTPGTTVDLGWTANNSTNAAYIALEIIPAGANSIPSLTVTATQGGATGGGMTLDLYVVTGQAASPAGATATAAALATAITPNASGSLVFGAILATGGAFTANGSTTLLYDNSLGLEYGSVVSNTTTTSGTPVTIGVTSSGGAAISIALLEVLAGTGLKAFVGTPGGVLSGSTAASTIPLAPPAGSLIVAMVSSNGTTGTTTMAVTDSSGLGLTWTERVKRNTANNGYVGIWTAVMPATTPGTVFGQPALGTGASGDGAAYTLGMQFTVAQDTPLTGIWFYSGGGATALPGHCAIFQVTGTGTGSIVTGTLNSSPGWSCAAGAGWARCAYDGTVTLLAANTYKVAIDKTGGQNVYTAASHYWDSTGAGTNGLNSGAVSAPNNAAGDGGQDTFNTSGWANYPASSFNASNYWIDVEVTPASGAAGAATLTGTGALSTAAVQGATAALTGTGSLTTAPSQRAIVTLSGTGSLIGTPVQGTQLTGQGLITTAFPPPLQDEAGAVITDEAGAAITDEGTTLPPPGVIIAPAALNGTGSLATASAQLAPATLSGAGSLATAVTQLAPAALAGTGSLATAVTQLAPAALAGTGSLATASAQAIPATLTGTGSITGSGSAAGGGGATLGGAGSLAAVSAQRAPATLAGAGSLSTTAVQGAGTTVTGAGSLASAGGPAGAVIVTGAGALTAGVTAQAGIILTGAGALGTAAILRGITTVTGAGSLAGAAGTVIPGAASLQGQGVVNAVPAQHPPQIAGSSTGTSVTEPYMSSASSVI